MWDDSCYWVSLYTRTITTSTLKNVSFLMNGLKAETMITKADSYAEVLGGLNNVL